MSGSAKALHGSLFGLEVARERLIESNFPVIIDEVVAEAAAKLKAEMCLGKRRRWKRMDRWGRPEPACCEGNIFAVQGREPFKCTADECARAMGVDVGHMAYDRLAQALPPAYVQLLYSQLCMHALHVEFGVRPITFDEHKAQPSASRRYLQGWLEGAGDASAEAGLGFVGAESSKAAGSEPNIKARPDGIGGDEREAPFRELYYSHVGGYDQRWASDEQPHTLETLKPHTVVRRDDWSVETLRGKNTLIELTTPEAKKLVGKIVTFIESSGAGTRATIILPSKHASWLGRQGFKEWGPGTIEGKACMHLGRRGGGSRESYLDHDWADTFMDPRDLGIGAEPKEAKRLRAWQELMCETEFWRGKGFPAEIEKVMTEGAPVDTVEGEGVAGYEIPQYPYASAEARREASVETDRAVAVGHMEYIPEEETERILRGFCVHPWTMAKQGDKWRACQDYSVGTNRVTVSGPFSLPTPWDVRRYLKPDSHFAKYDFT